jgi:hypothetical protein
VSAWAVGVLSIAGVVVGVLLQWTISEKQRRRDRREARTQRVAAVLGRMSPLLASLQPEGIALQTAFIVRSFYDDPWRALRGELGVLIASEPAGELRGRLAELEDAVEALFRSLLLLVDADLRRQVMDARQSSLGNVFEEAQERHTETDALLRGILDDLHGANAPGRASRWRKLAEG